MSTEVASLRPARRSKWDEAGTSDDRVPCALEAAAAAAARINNMLMARGKLKAPANVSVKTGNDTQVIAGMAKSSHEKVQVNLDINDIPAASRNKITLVQVQEEISKQTGTVVSTRGRYMTPEEKAVASPDDQPLHLHIKGSGADSVSLAVRMINDKIDAWVRGNGLYERVSLSDPGVAGISTTSQPPPPPCGFAAEAVPTYPPAAAMTAGATSGMLYAPPPPTPLPTVGFASPATVKTPASAYHPAPAYHQPPMPVVPQAAPVAYSHPTGNAFAPPASYSAPPSGFRMSTPLAQLQPGMHYVQEKVFVGLEHADPAFGLKASLEGPGGSYLQHIVRETGAKVHLRGRSSGYMEHASGREAFEPLYIYISHPRPEKLALARKLCEDLLQTVHDKYSAYQNSMSGQAGYSQMNSYGRMSMYRPAMQAQPVGTAWQGPDGMPTPSPQPPSANAQGLAYAQYPAPASMYQPSVQQQQQTQQTQQQQQQPAATVAASKRRFVEELDKADPSRLLGYQHGPIHLSHSSAGSSQSAAGMAASSLATRSGGADARSGDSELMPPPPPLSATFVVSRAADRDKGRMPPSPPSSAPSTAPAEGYSSSSPPKKAMKSDERLKYLIQYGDSSDEEEGKGPN
ncbi:unnamed protein product [Lampetra fluviatilis]